MVYACHALELICACWQEIPIVAKDATFLISLATEEFIKRLCKASQNVAEREKRATVQHRDIGTSLVQAARGFLRELFCAI